MARIKTYSVDNQISDNDIVIGSDADNLSQTKNYNVANLRQYVLSGLEPETGGTLKITTITETSETYLTPESWINNQDPAIEVLQYEIIFLILNGKTYIFRKNNATYGVGETQAVADDFTEIDVTSVINANLQDLDSVLEQGNVSQRNASIGELNIYDSDAIVDGYWNVRVSNGDFFIKDSNGVDLFLLRDGSVSLLNSSNPFSFKFNTDLLTDNSTATFQNASGTVAYLSDIPTNYISSITSPSDELDVTTVTGETTIVYTPKTEVKLIGSELVNSITNINYFSNGGSFSYDETLYPINGIDLKFNGNIISNGTDYGFYAFHYENGNNVIAPIEYLGSSIDATTLRVKFDLATYWNDTPGSRLSFVEINLYQGTLISEDGLYFEGTAPSSQVRYFNSWLVPYDYSRPYKVYTALLTQSGTDAPTAVVLENTIGDIVWSYDENGVYSANSVNKFIENKTIVFLGSVGDSDLTSAYTSRSFFVDSNKITISSFVNDAIPTTSNSLLLNTPIEIRVYN